jgi:Coenzyme PQQ synthesis protein D (PqqD)
LTVGGTTITAETTVVASGDQVSRLVGEETVILGLKGDMYFGLNPVGSRVWSLIQEPRTVAEVRDAILEEYQVEPAECERDVVDLLARLADQKLIEVRR